MGKARTCQEQAEAKSSKSFLVLFFKKERKESTSFLKKSKKLFSIWLRSTGSATRMFWALRWVGLTFVYLGVLRVFVVEIEGGWEDCVLQVGERDQQRLK